VLLYYAYTEHPTCLVSISTGIPRCSPAYFPAVFHVISKLRLNKRYIPAVCSDLTGRRVVEVALETVPITECEVDLYPQIHFPSLRRETKRRPVGFESKSFDKSPVSTMSLVKWIVLGLCCWGAVTDVSDATLLDIRGIEPLPLASPSALRPLLPIIIPL
jgi:hypothetical protein